MELKWITAMRLHMFIAKQFKPYIMVKWDYSTFMVKYSFNHIIP